MASFDWFPWYPVHYRRATRHLTDIQDLIYRRLIDEYMETREPLPDNDIALASISRVSVDVWTMARAIILPFFHQSDGKLFHKKCDEILDEQGSISKKKSRAGAAGAAKRWNKSIDISEGNSNSHTSAIPEALAIDSTGQDKTRHNKESDPPNPHVDYFERSRLDPKLPDAWLKACCDERGWPENIASDVWTKFSGYFGRKIGQAALKTPDEWAAEWRTWYRKENIPAQQLKDSGKRGGVVSKYEGMTRDEVIAEKRRTAETLQRIQSGGRA